MTTIRIGPQTEEGAYEVAVPEGAEPGEPVQFKGKSDEPLSAVVPEGKKPGDKFLVNVPTVMVRVPPGAQAGTEVMFQTLGDQQVRFTTVPSGLRVGHYFPVLLQTPVPRKQDANPEDAKEEEQEKDKVEDAILVETEAKKVEDAALVE